MAMTDEQKLIADLNATFKNADARPLSSWWNKPDAVGAAVCGEAEFAPDEPIGPYIPCTDAPYDGYLHTGFARWAESRGWHVEVYEPGVLFLVPLSSVGCLI